MLASALVLSAIAGVRRCQHSAVATDTKLEPLNKQVVGSVLVS